MTLLLIQISALLSTAAAADLDGDGCDDTYEANNACVSPDASLTAGTLVGSDSQIGAYASVGSDVTFGADVFVAPRSTLGGRDVSGGRSTVGDRTIIGRRATVGDDYTIAEDVVLSRSVTAGNGVQIGAGAAVGYASSIGDGVDIGANAAVGNFVSVGDHASVGALAVLARSVTIDSAATPSLGSQIDGIVGPESSLGTDVLVQSGARLRTQVTVGDGAQILSSARVGRGSHVGADATVSGTVRANATVDAGATVQSGATVARGATVCANATVPTSTLVPAGGTWPLEGCTAPASCAEIFANGDSTGSGMYTIDPDGLGPVDAYCDMDTAPGGWTLVWHSYHDNVEADATQRFTNTQDAAIADPLSASSWVNLIPVGDYALVESATALRYEYKDLSGNIGGSAGHQNVTATGTFSTLFDSPGPDNFVPVVVNELHGAQRQVSSGARLYWGACAVYATALRFETYRDGSYYNPVCHTNTYGNPSTPVANMDFSHFNDSHGAGWGTIGNAGWGANAYAHVANIWVR